MVIYFVIAILLALTAILSDLFNERSKKILYWSFIILLAFLAAFKGSSVNVDQKVYEELFNSTPKLHVLIHHFKEYCDAIKTELSFALLSSIMKEFSFTLVGIYIIYGLLGVYLKANAIKKLTSLCFLSLFIYYCNFYFLHEITQIRAGVSTGLILFSLFYLKENQYWKFTGIILLATFFHTSAALAFFLIFVRNIRANAVFWSIIYSLCVIICISGYNIGDILSLINVDYAKEKLDAYIKLQEKEQFTINYFNVALLVQYITIILCFFYQKKIEIENKYFNILLNMSCISVCCFFFFAQIPGFAYRISEIFNISQIILLPLLVNTMKPKVLAQSLVLIIGFGLLYINLIHAELTNEYTFFWS